MRNALFSFVWLALVGCDQAATADPETDQTLSDGNVTSVRFLQSDGKENCLGQSGPAAEFQLTRFDAALVDTIFIAVVSNERTYLGACNEGPIGRFCSELPNPSSEAVRLTLALAIKAAHLDPTPYESHLTTDASTIFFGLYPP